MRKILFDTSVYGKLVEDSKTSDLIKEKRKKEFIIYGCSTIRKELRNTPKDIIYGNRKVQTLLLEAYDSLIVKENHNLKFNDLVENLSNAYFKEYRKQKGNLGEKAMKNDLIIIATATIYQLDIIVSNDVKTMLGDKAIQSYKKVNGRYGIKDPEFKTYEKFKREL